MHNSFLSITLPPPHIQIREKFAAGLFDDYLLVNATRSKQILNSPEHQQLALEAAKESIVLLRNENNVLPLSQSFLKSISRIAVLGPNAGGGSDEEVQAAQQSQLGGYTFGFGASDVSRSNL